MSNDTVKKEFPDQKQRLAVCFGQWRGEALHPDFQRILGTFLSHFGLEGFNKFVDFVRLFSQNKPTQPPHGQNLCSQRLSVFASISLTNVKLRSYLLCGFGCVVVL